MVLTDESHSVRSLLISIILMVLTDESCSGRSLLISLILVGPY